MKPENLFLDSNYDLKIGDFGFATLRDKQDENGLFSTLLGTTGYMAPEIHLKQKYKGSQVDLFAAGIILFVMVAGHPPFASASPKDAYYKALALGQKQKFWDAHCRRKPNGKEFFSSEFK